MNPNISLDILDVSNVNNYLTYDVRKWGTVSWQVILNSTTSPLTVFELKWSGDGVRYNSFSTAKTATLPAYGAGSQPTVGIEPFPAGFAFLKVTINNVASGTAGDNVTCYVYGYDPAKGVTQLIPAATTFTTVFGGLGEGDVAGGPEGGGGLILH